MAATLSRAGAILPNGGWNHLTELFESGRWRRYHTERGISREHPGSQDRGRNLARSVDARGLARQYRARHDWLGRTRAAADAAAARKGPSPIWFSDCSRSRRRSRPSRRPSIVAGIRQPSVARTRRLPRRTRHVRPGQRPGAAAGLDLGDRAALSATAQRDVGQRERVPPSPHCRPDHHLRVTLGAVG